VGLVLWGLPIALLGFWTEAVAALFFLAAVGVGNSLLDVAGFTLVQRTVPNDVLARVFGVLETLVMVTVGLGALATPLLVELTGDRAALIVTGALLPVLALVVWRRLARLDATAHVAERELALLRGVPIFAPLAPPTIEHLATKLVPEKQPAGENIVCQGDVGDRFFIVAEGELDVTSDGRLLSRLGPGEFFGEIALLRDVPRTATVTSSTPVTLYTLERENFIAAVSGHPQSARTADAVIGTRLSRLGARTA
jgi:MFS family permease